jgi:hypothetical protein
MKSLDDIYNGPIYTTMNNDCDVDNITVTLNDYDNIATTYTLDTSKNITLDYDGYKVDTSITVGNEVITEEKLRKLNALLKVIEDLEDDNPLKECYNAQQMFDKMK